MLVYSLLMDPEKLVSDTKFTPNIAEELKLVPDTDFCSSDHFSVSANATTSPTISIAGAAIACSTAPGGNRIERAGDLALVFGGAIFNDRGRRFR